MPASFSIAYLDFYFMHTMERFSLGNFLCFSDKLLVFLLMHTISFNAVKKKILVKWGIVFQKQ